MWESESDEQNDNEVLCEIDLDFENDLLYLYSQGNELESQIYNRTFLHGFQIDKVKDNNSKVNRDCGINDKIKFRIIIKVHIHEPLI